MSDELQRLRAEVSEADRAILEAINRRIEIVRRIRAHKVETGLGFVDPDRERQMVDDAIRMNPGPLSEEGLRELYAEILDLVKREVER